MNWLKQNSLPIIVTAVVTIGLIRAYDWFTTEKETLHVTDSTAISEVDKDRNKAISERDNLTFKLNPTKDAEEPIRVVSGKIERPIVFSEVRDTVKKTVTRVPTSDVILYGTVDDEVSFYTVNLYAQALGADDRNLYIWNRKTPNFYFAVKDNGGILMTFNRPLVRWDGVYAGLGADLFQKPYLLLSARAWVLEYVEFELELNSRPGLQVEAKVRL